LPEDVKNIAEALINSRLGIYDIISAETDTYSVALRDLFSMGMIRIQDPNITRVAGSPLFLGLRLVKLDNRYYSVGDLYAYPEDYKKQLLIYLRDHLIDPRAIVPPSIKEVLKKRGYILNYMQMMVLQSSNIRRRKDISEEEEEEQLTESRSAQKTPAEKPKEKQADETPAKAHFLVDDFDKTRNILDSIALIVKEREDEKSAEYIWFKLPAHKAQNHVDGVIKLTRGKLIVEVKGTENLEAAKNVLIKSLKLSIKHLYDELEKRRGFAAK
jgi:hypothetical protein